MELWKDGRSGPAGCVAGNLVLADIEFAGDKLAARKGTTFSGRNCLYVGRVCAKDDYLQKGTRHWANLSPTQHQTLALEAGREDKEMFYLFITATRAPAAVHYWKVPGKVVGKLLRSLPVKPSDDSCWIRIREESGKQFLEGGKANGLEVEVTRYHHEIPLGADQAAALQQAFQKPPLAGDQAGDITAEQLLQLNSLVRDLGGVATVRRALAILGNLKE
jgi:hypothetical protein